MKIVNFQKLSNLLINVFTDGVTILMCVTIGFAFGRGTNNVNDAMPFLGIVSLLLLFASTLLDLLVNGTRP